MTDQLEHAHHFSETREVAAVVGARTSERLHALEGPQCDEHRDDERGDQQKLIADAEQELLHGVDQGRR